MIRPLFILISIFILISCSEDSPKQKNVDLSFNLISPERSGFDFQNMLDETKLVSPFNYINVYNGGGVAIGDIDNDGLQDILMTGNMVPCKLYKNGGEMKFKDITKSSGLNTFGWATAATMADVNNDGWLDIYICRAYDERPEIRKNLYFENNKDGTFTEKGKELGIDDENFSIASAFFDYDRDGDLDLIVGNHPRHRLVSLTTHYKYWTNPVKEYSSRLFKNENGKFLDVTEEAGILSYGFVLGLTTSDLNNDGYPDIFVSVDHDEPDMIFMNNGDGSFTNKVDDALKQSSLSSMGIDAGDVNHDLYPDVLVVEMLSEDHFREKVVMSMQSVQRFTFLTDTLNYKYYQMRNYLHLNNGNGTFSDIGQLAGISKTDWSWGALFADFDNDSWQDLHIVNGYYRDIHNKDASKKLDSIMITLGNDVQAKDRLASEYSRNSPQTKISNYLFTGQRDLQYQRKQQIGMDEKTISTGSAYADLDNDGDLDLVINNLGEYSMIYENKTNSSNNYLRVKCKGSSSLNPIGTRLIAKYNGENQIREILSTRGYQSCSELVAHFGLGENEKIDELIVIWPNGKYQSLQNIKANQTIVISSEDAQGQYTFENKSSIAKSIDDKLGIDYTQQENDYNDYDDQVLLPHKMSELGPKMCKGDVNGDGLEDLIVASPTGQATALFVQNENGRFTISSQPSFSKDKKHEDGDVVLFDADGDNDLDLVVTSSGYEFDENSLELQLRYYENKSGQFTRVKSAIPNWRFASNCVELVDFDEDGDVDMFVGGRLTPKKYPFAGTSALFENDGAGVFKDATEKWSTELRNMGMVTDATWTDYDRDGSVDLIVVGEWMPITFFKNENGRLVNKSNEYLTVPNNGWWNCIEAKDLDGDGFDDFVLGNLGLNYKYKASEEKPFYIYGGDYDNSGTNDIVLGTYYGDKIYPVRGKSCSSEQMPELLEKFETYTEFASAELFDVYGEEELNKGIKYTADNFSSSILYQNENGGFELVHLPRIAQKSPLNDVIFQDMNHDSKMDMVLAGNLYQAEIETGRADAGTGLVLLNEGNRKWKSLSVYESGVYLANDVKSLETISIGKNRKENIIIAGNNRGPVEVLKLESH